ncbi:MAG: hypothetical protein Q8P54_03040 [bacterium]|nr:hypothetical protein [bacterium]
MELSTSFFKYFLINAKISGSREILEMYVKSGSVQGAVAIFISYASQERLIITDEEAKNISSKVPDEYLVRQGSGQNTSVIIEKRPS